MFLLVLPNLQATKAGAASMIHYMVLISARLVLLTLCGWVLCWTLVNLFRSHSVLNLLFLGYPWVLQFYHFIVNLLRNYLDHANDSMKEGKMKFLKYKSSENSLSILFLRFVHLVPWVSSISLCDYTSLFSYFWIPGLFSVWNHY